MRIDVGPKFSAAAVMLWSLKTRLELTNETMGDIIGCASSQVSKILWGDISPTVPQTGKIEAYTKQHKPVIRAGHWSEPAPKGWEPPPVAEARAKLAPKPNEGDAKDRDDTLQGFDNGTKSKPFDSAPSVPEAQ